MLRGWQTIAVVATLAAYVGFFWFWKVSAFPTDIESILPGANFINVAVSVVVALFTVVLAKVGRRQVQDTRILQRAYLSVEPHGIHQMSDTPDLVAHVQVTDAGNLPARTVKWKIKTLFEDNGNRPTFELKDSELYGNNVVTPKSKMIQGSGPMRLKKLLRQFSLATKEITHWTRPLFYLEIPFRSCSGSRGFTAFFPLCSKL
jgi:hypothetical protein